MRPKPSNQPRWFNRKANKLVTKHRKTYNKYKDSDDLFLLTKYKQERRLHRAELRKIEQDYISTKICKPLETGNSKPFYQHLKWSQGVTKPPMKLKTEGNDHTEDPTESANILNEFFSSQFCKQHELDSNNAYNCTGLSIEVSDAGVDLREEDLVIDSIMTAKCLTSILKVSLSTATLPGEWKLSELVTEHFFFRHGGNFPIFSCYTSTLTLNSKRVFCDQFVMEEWQTIRRLFGVKMVEF